MSFQGQIASSTVNKTRKCRNRNGFLREDEFNMRACAECYGYLFHGEKRLQLVETTGLLEDVNRTTAVVADLQNLTAVDLICQTLNGDECNRWRLCCISASICCMEQLQQEADVAETSGYCPKTWDGFACWDKAPAGQELTRPCPAFIPHAMPSGKLSTSLAPSSLALGCFTLS